MVDIFQVCYALIGSFLVARDAHVCPKTSPVLKYLFNHGWRQHDVDEMGATA